ncbi:ribulose-phosphate 3-epimerase [Buchnera aphidicola (Mindarus keteleerifoliae)]|uniref:ribulose-phosphate 3-epimerase n=1 Tax=Buchnera aphidicola TaxID=9 RepID=UPI0031B6BA55
MKNFFLAPSVLSANFSKLGEDIQKSIDAGGDIIHFDVMDNHYVENLTFGPMVLQSLRDYKISAKIDVHLMASPVDSLIPKFAKSGADFISVHPESTNHIDRTLRMIKDYGCKAGISLNPGTPINYLDYVMDQLDMITVMSVNPGFGGQTFIPESINKIRQVRQRINESSNNILLEVDGGINIKNISDIALAGANVFVIGSALFGSSDYTFVIRKLRQELKKVHFNLMN